MCDLGGWDGAILISGRALSDLVIALDESIRDSIEAAQALQPDESDDCDPVGCLEHLLNIELLVPRVLYALKDPAYEPDYGDDPSSLDELETLHARLQEYVAIALANGDAVDPGHCLTFVRDEWFERDGNPPLIVLNPDDAPPDTVRLTFSGHVAIGDRFVDSLTALASPYRFTMSLDYRPGLGRSSIFLPDGLDAGLLAFPYITLPEVWEVSPPPDGEDLWWLPPARRPIWAQTVDNPDIDLPGWDCGEASTLPFHWRLTTAADYNPAPESDVRVNRLFTGAPGECLVDPESGLSRWVVEDRFPLRDGRQTAPRRLLVDTAAGDQPIAESNRGHAGLLFQEVAMLWFEGHPQLPAAETAAVRRSIMKLNGFIVGAWLDPMLRAVVPGVPAPTLQELSMLALLGGHGMDFAPLPAQLAPEEPYSSFQDGVEFMDGDVIFFQDGATRVFDRSGDDSGAIALGGVLRHRLEDEEDPPPEEPLPYNVTNGQDLTIGCSQAVVDRWMRIPMEDDVRNGVRRHVPGFDRREWRFVLDLTPNGVQVRIRGAGVLEFPPLGFGFSVRFPLHLEPWPAVWRSGTGREIPLEERARPLDIRGELLPGHLGCVDLNLRRGDLCASDPDINPLCFLGYLDPRDPEFDPNQQPTPPWESVDLETGCHDGDEPYIFEPAAPVEFQWQEANFSVPPFRCSVDAQDDRCVPALRPGLELVAVPPTVDEVDVDVDLSFLVNLFTAFVTEALLDIVVTGRGAHLIRRGRGGLGATFADIDPVNPSQTGSWQLFLQHSDPLAPSNDAISYSDGAMCLRFRLIPGPDPALGAWAPAICEEICAFFP